MRQSTSRWNSAKGISKQTISLKDNAETIQTKLGMTVDDMLAGLESGKVVFYNINTSRAAWNKAAMTKGSTGWYYDASGNITTDASDVASVEIDKTNKCLIVDAPEDAAAGTSISVNVGFAVNNGKDYDKVCTFLSRHCRYRPRTHHADYYDSYG